MIAYLNLYIYVCNFLMTTFFHKGTLKVTLVKDTMEAQKILTKSNYYAKNELWKHINLTQKNGESMFNLTAVHQPILQFTRPY